MDLINAFIYLINVCILSILWWLVDEYTNLHPYKEEISKLMKNPNLEFLDVLDGCVKWELDMHDSYVWIETVAQLLDLVKVLSNERVFAVDTEQHSFRSFSGFTALIQVPHCHFREYPVVLLCC